MACKSIVHHKQVTIAWEYCTKADENYVESVNHPDFTCAARTTATIKCKQAAAKDAKNGESKRKRKKFFDTLGLQFIVIKNCLKTKSGLLRLANKQSPEGKTDTALYIVKITSTCNEYHGHELGNRRCNEG